MYIRLSYYDGPLWGVCVCNHLTFTGCRAVKDGDICHTALYESCDIPHIVISAKLWSARGPE